MQDKFADCKKSSKKILFAFEKVQFYYILKKFSNN